MAAKRKAQPEPQRHRLTQSQQYVLVNAEEQAAQIRQRALAMVCAELGIAIPERATLTDGELVVG